MAKYKINHDTTKANSFAVIISIVATILLLIIIFIGSYYMYRSLLSISQNQLQDNASRHPYITEIEDNANNELKSLKWIDKKVGKVHVPIDIAKEQIVKEYN